VEGTVTFWKGLFEQPNVPVLPFGTMPRASTIAPAAGYGVYPVAQEEAVQFKMLFRITQMSALLEL
jgi:hypothetical protein